MSLNRHDEWLHKLEAVRGWLRQLGAHAALFGSQNAFAWITCGGDNHVSLGQEAGAASILVTSGHAFLLAANNEMPRLVDEQVVSLPLEPVTWPWYEPDNARAVVHRLAGERVVSDLGQLGLARADSSTLRFTLLEPEVARYRELGRDAAAALERVCETARPGQSEQAIAAELVAGCHASHLVPLVVLVGTDERIARYRHPLPTDRPCRRTLLVAVTARRQGLHASLTRMVSFGPPDDELMARFSAVQRVNAGMLLESRPNVSLGEVLARAQALYQAEGFSDEWRQHHQGGLTGYAGRERFASPGAKLRLQSQQAVAWNPSITRVKSEDTALVTDAGPVLLTRTSGWPRDNVRVTAGAVELASLLVRTG